MKNLLVLLTMFSAVAFADGNSPISYYGQVLAADGTPDAGLITFQIQVYSPGTENCLLYSSTLTQDLTQLEGFFNLNVIDPNFNLSFLNNLPFNSLKTGSCAIGKGYIPRLTDGRRVVILYNDGKFVGWRSLGYQTTSILFSHDIALNSMMVGGFAVNDLLRVQDSNGNPYAVSALSPDNFTSLMALINGTSTSYVQSKAGSGISLPVITTAPTTPVEGSVWFNGSTMSINYYDGKTTHSVGASAGGGTVTSVNTGTGLTGGPITATGTIALATVNAAAGTGTKVNYDVYGRVTGSAPLAQTDLPTISTPGLVSGSAITSGTIGGATNINTSGKITASGISATGGSFNSLQLWNAATTNNIALTAPAGLAANYSLILPANAGATGQVLSTDGKGNLSWSTASTGASVGEQLPTACTSEQTMTFNSVTNKFVCTEISIPIADVTGLASALSSLSWAKIAGTPTTLAGYGITNAMQNNGGAPGVQEGLDAAKPAAGNAGLIYIATDTFKIYRDNGSSWDSISQQSAGGGGEISGAAGGDLSGNYPAPSVRAIQGFAVNPLAPVAGQFFKFNGGSWSGASINLSDLKSSISGNLFNSPACNSNQTLSWNAVADQFTCNAIAGLDASTIVSGTLAANLLPSNAVVIGGNNVTSTMQVGASSANDLALLAGGATQVTVGASGNVGIGTTVAAASLDVSSRSDAVIVASGTSAQRPAGGVGGMIRYNTTTSALEGFINNAWQSITTGADSAYLSTSGGNVTGNLDVSGNVGIGTTNPAATLDVAGSVRVGSSAAPCTSANIGAVMFDGTNFNGCYASGWQALQPAPVQSGATQNTPGTSCLQILMGGYSTGNGVYWISVGAGHLMQVYCDMVSDGGGWTLVVGIQGNSQNHLTPNAVTPANLTSPSGFGKLSDWVINSLTTNSIRMTCGTYTGYWADTCSFSATGVAAFGCATMANTYGGAYGATTVQTGVLGIADGGKGTANRLIYGEGGENGCDVPTGWSNLAGTLWVK